jgi:hypothetical protein
LPYHRRSIRMVMSYAGSTRVSIALHDKRSKEDGLPGQARQ